MHYAEILGPVRNWVESVVIGLNLCPFARREWASDRVRMFVSEARTPEDLLVDLEEELSLLSADTTLETTLLVHPWVLEDFSAYNQFLDVVDVLLQLKGWTGVFQVASFHPDYQFAGTEPDDVENATNRSPYPILHLLRERSLTGAIASHPDPSRIPEDNIKLLREMGQEKVKQLLAACFDTK